MKLLDILLQEKIEWPEGMVWCVQDDDGGIKFSSDKQFRPRYDDNSGIWSRGPIGGNETEVRGYPVSEDYKTSIITWEECRNYNYSLAKDAYDNRFQQNNKEEEKDSHAKDLWFKKGEAPPVGTICEILRDNEWTKVEILKNRSNNSGTKVSVAMEVESFQLFWAANHNFRPIKTQKEIEREKAIEDMKSLCKYKGSWELIFKAFAEDLIDAGYHK